MTDRNGLRGESSSLDLTGHPASDSLIIKMPQYVRSDLSSRGYKNRYPVVALCRQMIPAN